MHTNYNLKLLKMLNTLCNLYSPYPISSSSSKLPRNEFMFAVHRICKRSRYPNSGPVSSLQLDKEMKYASAAARSGSFQQQYRFGNTWNGSDNNSVPLHIDLLSFISEERASHLSRTPYLLTLNRTIKGYFRKRIYNAEIIRKHSLKC